jgi:hypothetical protein
MLRRYTWESQKKKLQHYKRRQPETSVLYQIVYHGHEELQHVWEPRFQHQYGCLRDEVTKTLTEYLNCGILAHGAARVYCDGCKHSLLIAFSPVVSLSNRANAEGYAPHAELSAL